MTEEVKNQTINELVPVTNKEINNENVHAVNARELHVFLGNKDKYATWISDRIDQYKFTENIDYIIFSEKSEKRGRPRIEYFITLDMAKELAMVERNDKGREARKYFIECEKKYKESIALTPKQRFQLDIVSAETEVDRAVALSNYEIGYVKPLEKAVERMAPKEQFYDSVVQSESTLDVGTASKVLNYQGFGRNKLYKYLRDKNIFNQKNIPYQQYIAQGYFKLVESSWLNPQTQELQVTVKPVFYQKGLDWLDKKLKDEGYIRNK